MDNLVDKYKLSDKCVCCIITQFFATPIAGIAGIIPTVTMSTVKVGGGFALGTAACGCVNLGVAWCQESDESEKAVARAWSRFGTTLSSLRSNNQVHPEPNNQVHPEPVKKEVK